LKYIVVIPARGGSKGLPGKNIKLLGGIPLIQHTIDAAKEVFRESEIIVSTDNGEIQRVVIENGLAVPFLRPESLATDNAGTYDVLLHAIEHLEAQGIYKDVLVLLQPTSPLRQSQHIKEALALYKPDLDMVVSVKETASNPYYVLKEENELGFLENSKKGNFISRQSCPKVWELNGAIYIININSLKKMEIGDFTKVKKYVMDEKSSHDIDSYLDFLVCEQLYNLDKI
jgi:N-acylneuraminate cytidylyltransferase